LFFPTFQNTLVSEKEKKLSLLSLLVSELLKEATSAVNRSLDPLMLEETHMKQSFSEPLGFRTNISRFIEH
jgi:hypothetical protein